MVGLLKVKVLHTVCWAGPSDSGSLTWNRESGGSGALGCPGVRLMGKRIKSPL